MVAPVSGINSSTDETTQSLRQSAVSSEIILDDVNCDNFSLQIKMSCKSFFMTSPENLEPKGLVDSENNSFGSFLSEVHVTQLSETSSTILAYPGL